MNLPVASCLVCGQQKELAVWVDPAITGGSFHGVCFQCREAAQQMRAADFSVREAFPLNKHIPDDSGGAFFVHWSCHNCLPDDYDTSDRCHHCGKLRSDKLASR